MDIHRHLRSVRSCWDNLVFRTSTKCGANFKMKDDRFFSESTTFMKIVLLHWFTSYNIRKQSLVKTPQLASQPDAVSSRADVGHSSRRHNWTDLAKDVGDDHYSKFSDAAGRKESKRRASRERRNRRRRVGGGGGRCSNNSHKLAGKKISSWERRQRQDESGN